MNCQLILLYFFFRFGDLIFNLLFKFFRPEWNDDPLHIHLENIKSTLYTIDTPGSGSILAFIMNVLDGYNFDNSSVSSEEELLTHQRITETYKYAYAERTYLGDHNFVDVEDVSERSRPIG